MEFYVFCKLFILNNMLSSIYRVTMTIEVMLCFVIYVQGGNDNWSYVMLCLVIYVQGGNDNWSYVKGGHAKVYTFIFKKLTNN